VRGNCRPTSRQPSASWCISGQGHRNLPHILNRRTAAGAHAVHGQRIESGNIYIAPPDFHLLLGARKVAPYARAALQRHAPSD